MIVGLSPAFCMCSRLAVVGAIALRTTDCRRRSTIGSTAGGVEAFGSRCSTRWWISGPWLVVTGHRQHLRQGAAGCLRRKRGVRRRRSAAHAAAGDQGPCAHRHHRSTEPTDADRGQLQRCEGRMGASRSRRPMRHLLADNGYDADGLRRSLRQAVATPVIPGRRNRKHVLWYEGALLQPPSHLECVLSAQGLPASCHSLRQVRCQLPIWCRALSRHRVLVMNVSRP